MTFLLADLSYLLYSSTLPALPLSYSPTLLLSHSPTLLLSYSPTLLLSYSPTLPLSHSPTLPLSYLQSGPPCSALTCRLIETTSTSPPMLAGRDPEMLLLRAW